MRCPLLWKASNGWLFDREKLAVMGIPLQEEGEGGRIAALLQGEMKDRIADATAQHRTIRQGPLPRRRGPGKKTEMCAACLFLS